MRSIIRAALVAMAVTAATSAQASAQGQKFAYIQSSKILEQAPGRAQAESLFAKEAGTYEAEIKRMSDSLDIYVQAFQKTQAAMTPAKRDGETKILQARELGYQTRTRDLQAKANARQGELIQPVLDRAKQAIEDVRLEGGYSFIFNVDQGSPIVAVDKNLDMTDRVLAKLRSQPAPVLGGPSKPATTAPAPAPSGVTRPTTPPSE